MSVLSYGEDNGLELFIETLTEAQKAEISKEFENYHKTCRLKCGAANAARVRFAKSSDALSESEREGDEPPQSDDGEDSEDEGCHNLFKAIAAQRKETASRYSSTEKNGQGNVPSPPRKPDRGNKLEQISRERVLRLVRAVRWPTPNLLTIDPAITLGGRNRVQAWTTKRKLLGRQAYTLIEVDVPYRTLSAL